MTFAYLLHTFRPLGHNTSGLQNSHNFPYLFSDRGAERIAGLPNLWLELLPDIHQLLFLLFREIQFPKIDNLMGQAITDHLSAFRSQILDRLPLFRSEYAPNLRHLIANDVLQLLGNVLKLGRLLALEVERLQDFLAILVGLGRFFSGLLLFVG